MTVWNSLFDASLQEIGVLASGETGATADRTLALGHLNRMLGAWSLELTSLYFQTTESLTWASGNASRTIGSGGDLNTTRPQRIIGAQYRIGDTDFNLDIIDHDEYQAISDKASTSSYPSVIAYNPTNSSARGTLFMWPVPSSNLTFRLTSFSPYSTITDATAESGLPPGYENAVVLNLAYRLQKPFLKQNDPQLERDAYAAYRSLKIPSMTLNPSYADDMMPSQCDSYNILIDE